VSGAVVGGLGTTDETRETGRPDPGKPGRDVSSPHLNALKGIGTPGEVPPVERSRAGITG
jgi:hypothetical protein